MMVKVRNHLLYDHSEYVRAWVAERIPVVDTYGFAEGKGIGVLSNDGTRLIAGVVYTDYQPVYETMQLHIAADSPMWAQKPLIKALLSYPFDQLNIFKCWIAMPSDVETPIKVTKHIGFKPEATLAHHFGRKRHGIISRMFKPDFERLYGDI